MENENQNQNEQRNEQTHYYYVYELSYALWREGCGWEMEDTLAWDCAEHTKMNAESAKQWLKDYILEGDIEERDGYDQEYTVKFWEVSRDTYDKIKLHFNIDDISYDEPDVEESIWESEVLEEIRNEEDE